MYSGSSAWQLALNTDANLTYQISICFISKYTLNVSKAHAEANVLNLLTLSVQRQLNR
jgi:hypothetical protein